jgi:hypothetical protein
MSTAPSTASSSRGFDEINPPPPAVVPMPGPEQECRKKQCQTCMVHHVFGEEAKVELHLHGRGGDQLTAHAVPRV